MNDEYVEIAFFPEADNVFAGMVKSLSLITTPLSELKIRLYHDLSIVIVQHML